jgi:hypothetical protein
MARPLLSAAAALSIGALAGGCTTDGDFPSLAPRAIEQEDPLAEPVRTPPVVASDPALLARVRELRAGGFAGAAAFETEARAAEAAAARAGASGSESWVVAQQALSRLEAARGPAAVALAELDRLLILRAAEPTAADDFAAIRMALAEVENLAADQQRRIDQVRSRISR